MSVWGASRWNIGVLVRKRALITGITGQDGSYLAELLLAKGYEVFGLVRRNSSFHSWRIDHMHFQADGEMSKRLSLVYGDLADGGRLHEIMKEVRPHEVYNLAAQSHVRVSFDVPEYTADVTGLGTLRLLEALRTHAPEARFYQASSSEMFGSTMPPQDESTVFHPRSPYGAAKVYSHWIAQNYRESYGLFIASGILFNHESPRRGETFVTRKISMAAARIACGFEHELRLGNLDAVRDWGYAPEYVIAMWRMLQVDEPGDFVVGTGEAISVEGFLETAFSFVGLNWRDYVTFDERLLRPAEVNSLIANPALAGKRLSWSAETRAPELAQIMVKTDIEFLRGLKIDIPQSSMWAQETEFEI